jgi:acyl-CoA reductase-like NAD-dependent aldehyde dehydrogenase
MQVLKQPVGPVAAFAPWNFPLVLSARKIGGALAAGCSIILKAAEETPASVAAMVDCFGAEVPPGTLQLLYGVPAELSEQLIASPIIRKVTFTGSVPVGRHLAQLAAKHLKRITLELGGHAPVIVCADADIDKTVAQMVAHKFRNAGQACLAPTRFYVDRGIEGDFLDAFTAASQRLVLGDGMTHTTQMGPLANARRLAAVNSLIDRSVQAGAKVHQGAAPTSGFFAPVSLLTDVTPDSPVIQEEPFGPVATLSAFDNIDHALHLANQSAYGLAGYLFTDCPHHSESFGSIGSWQPSHQRHGRFGS